MSLIRQFWLLLVAALALAFAGSVAIGVNALRETLQSQLRIRNSDNATILALALSQLRGEPEAMTALVRAQFDTGAFQQIGLALSDGRELSLRRDPATPADAPAWFVAVAPIESVPGRAQVSDGDRASASVLLAGHAAFAHDELWQASLRIAAALSMVGVLVGLIGASVIRRIRRPLDKVVAHAKTLEKGEFLNVPESRALELRVLTRAMNGMVARLKMIFEAQAQQVEYMRQQANGDALTGLSNRKHFMGQLTAALQREDGAAEGGLVLLRVIDLAGLNRNLGHDGVDRVLAAIAQALKAYTERVRGSHLGRLNGSDFALCLPVGGVAKETALAMSEALRVLLPSFGPGFGVAFGAVELQRDRDLAHMLALADAALAQAESRGAFAVELGGADRQALALLGESAWQQRIADALRQERARLVAFPLIDVRGQLIHLECPLRLQFEPQGAFEEAARWLSMALRVRLTAAVDERAVALALAASARDGLPRCVNLATASLGDSGFAARLRAQVLAAPAAGRLLSVEVPESAVLERFEWVQELSRQLRPCGVLLGVEHAGERVERIDRLYEAGLDFVKLDVVTTQGVLGDAQRASFVRSVVAMLHGLSLRVHAEGVADAADAQVLWTLGLDGVCGAGASAVHGEAVA